MLHWKQLTNLTDDVLATYDIAAVNLACTADLPDAPGPLIVMECLHKLDEWAKLVHRYTESSYAQFFCKDPARYGHSEAYFRSLCLATVLQRHCGLRYNPDKIPEDVPLETADTFIHGAILGEGGTCASIPVVLAAVGRRLGYPIKIAETKGIKWGHVFARWDDPSGERLNLEVAGRGLNTYTDDYYRTGRYALDLVTEREGQFLKSMTPREELAAFLAERALFWKRLGHWRFMAEAYAWALSLVPANAFYRNMLNVATNGWLYEQEKRKPPGFPEVIVEPLIRHFPMLPLEKEQQILGRTVLDNVLHDAELDRDFWAPMRRGVRLSRVPVQLLARFKADGGCNITIDFVRRN
jgi:hypothetical protein